MRGKINPEGFDDFIPEYGEEFIGMVKWFVEQKRWPWSFTEAEMEAFRRMTERFGIDTSKFR